MTHSEVEEISMNALATKILLILFAVAIYVALPAAIVSGWVHWARRKQQLTVPLALSLIGFTLATASGLLAISSVVYALAIHGFRYYDPTLLRIFRWGGLLSLSGMVLGIGGIWRPSPLRWYAPCCAAGMLLFWFAMAAGE
jgi:hypothetical protein